MELQRLDGWLVAVAVTGIGWAFGWLLRITVLPLIAAVVRRSRTHVDDALLDALRPHVPIWFLLLGAVVGARYAPLAPITRHGVDMVSEALLILSVALATSSFITRLLGRSAERWAGTPGGTSLIQNVARAGVLGTALLVILGNLGVSVTPVLTALGLGSLAIALGLQPTLTNLFAGFHVTMARQVRVGDFVEIESGMQGVIEDIGWRATQIREPANNLIVVPNAKLAEIVLRNYSRPSPEIGFGVPVTVAYGSDLDRVERVTLEVAREVQKTADGAAPGHEPLVLVSGFGELGLGLNVVMRARSVGQRGQVVSELLRHLHARYLAEGIEIASVPRMAHRAPRA